MADLDRAKIFEQALKELDIPQPLRSDTATNEEEAVEAALVRLASCSGASFICLGWPKPWKS